MEASTSTPENESTENIKKEYTESDIEINEEWLAGNYEYIERKVLKELKLKRKREEKNHLVNGQVVTAARYRKFKKIEDKGKERVINVEEDAERKRKIKGSWTANGEKETGKRRLERVKRSILATVERPVQKLLKNVFEGDNVSDMDWCSYIIECANVSNLDWVTKLKKGRCVLWASDVLD
nr:hypothetical protein [Tanacetum cinerariifolium]